MLVYRKAKGEDSDDQTAHRSFKFDPYITSKSK